jgi:hypothetical protein
MTVFRKLSELIVILHIFQVQYIRDCKKIYGRILNNDNVESSIGTKSKIQSEKVWKELYHEEPFELEYTSSSETTMDVNPGATEGISYDLISAVKRQSSFYYQVFKQPLLHYMLCTSVPDYTINPKNCHLNFNSR